MIVFINSRVTNSGDFIMFFTIDGFRQQRQLNATGDGVQNGRFKHGNMENRMNESHGGR